MQTDSIEKAFYHDGFQLGIKATAEGFSKQKLLAAVAEMYNAMDSLIDSLQVFAQQQGQQIACKKGCEWCCHQPVFAMDYELDFLKAFIENNFTAEEQKQINEKAIQKNNRLKELDGDTLLNAKHPCPLLENGACKAYAARPVACRIYLSSNLKSCLKFYQEPEDKTNYPALLDFPMRIGRIMNEGFKAGLKANGLLSNEFRIEEKLGGRVSNSGKSGT